MADASTIRKRLEMQGFYGLDYETLAEIGPWMRWSPALCCTVMIVGNVAATKPARAGRERRDDGPGRPVPRDGFRAPAAVRLE